MEAVPRMPMIAFELKTSSDQVDFTPGLLGYIKDHYNEDPTKYQKECADLDQLRQGAINVSRDFMGCSTLKKYYSQLQFLQSRFPLGDGGLVAVPFTWDDVYSGKSVTHVDIRFEQAAILYNIGALHSFLGAMDKRGSPEGMKVSCTHFQCASWAYQHLRENFSNSYSPDMTSDLLTFKINLMLAQAQECILEKSMTDNRKSTITAKVAAQIVEYYKQANKTLDTNEVAGIISSRRIKEWKKRLELKSQYYQSIMYLYLSNQSEEQQKWGERVAYMQASMDKLEEAGKLNKGDDEEVEEALKFTNDVIGAKLAAAKKDNDFIYHEKVPDIRSMPDVKGASLVKGIPFSAKDPEVSGPDIFQKLVPMEAHEASSVYSEEKAKLLRIVGDAVETKDVELEQFMSSLQIDSASLRPQPQRIPQELLEKCAAISVRPDAIKDLVSSMQSLSGLAMDVEGNLNDIENVIAKEKEVENEFQEAYGKRSPNTVLDELLKECQKYLEGLQKASQSNMELHKAMNTHISNLKLLSGPLDKLQEAIPSVESTRSTEDEAVVSEVQRLLTKVEEMKTQRQSLAEQFRQQVLQDDITSSLVTREQDSNQEFFSQQLKKHESLRGLIEQNMSAQGNILRALTEANAKFAQIRKTTSTTSQRRENMIQELIQSYDVYGDLLAKSQKGIEFYQKLDSNVSRLLDRVKRNVKVCEEEREQIIHRTKPKGVVPARPSAAKPGSVPSGIPGIPDLPAAALAYLPSSVPGKMPADVSESKIKGPTLKDNLPFMKPASFGHMAADLGKMPYSGLSGYAGGNIPSASSLPQIPTHSMYQPPSGGSQQIPTGPQPASWPSSQNSSPAHVPKSASPTTSGQKANAEYPGSVAVPKKDDIPTLPSGYSYVNDDDSDERSSSPAYTQSNVAANNPVPSVANTSTVPTSVQYYNSAQYSQYQSYIQGYVSTASQAVPNQTPVSSSQNTNVYKYQQEYNYNPQMRQQYIPQTAVSAGQASQTQNYSVAGYQQPVHTTVPASSTMPPTSYGGYYSQLASQPNFVQRQNFPTQIGSSYMSNIQPSTTQIASSYSGQTQPVSSQIGYGSQSQPSTTHIGSGYGGQGQPGTTQIASGYGGQGQPATTQISSGYGGQGQPATTQISSGYGAQSQAGTTKIASGYGVKGQPATTQFASGYGGHGQPATTQISSGYGPQSQPGTTQFASGYGGKGQPATTQFASGYGGQGQPATTQISSGYGGQSQPGTTQIASVYGIQSQPATTQIASGYGGQGQPATTQISSGYGGQSQPSSTQFGSSYVGQTTNQMGSSYNMQMQVTGTQTGHSYSTQIPPTASTVGGHMPPVASPASVQGYIGQPQVSTGYSSAGYNSAVSYGQQMTYYQTSQAQSGKAQSDSTYSSAYRNLNTSTTSHQNQHNQPGYPQYSSSTGGSQYPNQVNSTVTGQATQYYVPSTPQGTTLNPISSVSTCQPVVQNRGYTSQGYVSTSQTNVVYTQSGSIVNHQAPSTVYQQQGVQQGQGQQHGQGQFQQQQTASLYNYQTSQVAQGSYGGYQAQQQTTGQHVAGVMQPGTNANVQPNQGKDKIVADSPYTQELSSLNISTGGLLPALEPKQVNSVKPSEYPNNQQASGQNYVPVQTNVAASPGPVRGTSSNPKLERQNSGSTTSSLDDLLSSSPATDKHQPKDVLKPKVITEADIKRQKEEEYKNSLKTNTKDPYDDPALLEKFVIEVEKFEKMMENLLKPTLSGPSHLETLWKELSAEQEGIARNLGMAIARCYPLKNRSPDLMPYDSNRVVLSTGKDDYINASHIDDMSACCPRFISTQSPLPGTCSDFWLMVYEQGTEVIVMLASENETGQHKNHIYWPTEKGKPIQHGAIQLNLQSEKSNNCWIERIINITHKEKKQSRAVVHLQFPDWLPGGVPNSPGPVLQFIKQVNYFYIHQRNLMKPVIVHCSLGVGRTGTFCIVYIGVQEICQGRGMIDIPILLKQLMAKRKYILNEIDQLKFCYHSVLYHAQDILMKRGILTNRASFSDKPGTPSSHQRKPSEDFILGSAGFSAVQSGVAKMWPKGSTGPPSVHNTGTNNAISEVHDQTEPHGSVSSPALTSCGEVQKPGSGPPSGVGSPARPRSRSGSPASVQSHTSMNSAHGSGTSSPLHKAKNSTFTNLPPTLASLSNPSTFTIGEGEKKTTRANFDKSGNIREQTPDPNDPFTNLDPLWTMKK